MSEQAGQEITRSMILRLQDAIRRDENSEVPDGASAEAATLPNGAAENSALTPSQSHEAGASTDDGSDVPGAAVRELPFHNPDIEREAKSPRLDDPSRIRKPLLLADYAGSAVMVRLDRLPTAPGLAFIKYEDGRGELEVELGVLSNWTLTDSKVSP